MNKLIVDKEKNVEIKDNVINLEIQEEELTLNIKGKVLINEIGTKDNEKLKLTINIAPQSSLVYNRFLVHNTMHTEITINQQTDSQVRFNYSLIATDKSNLKINSNLTGNKNETSINIKAVTEEHGIVNISSTADTKPKIEENNLLESIRILLLNDEENVCIPNLLVASNEIAVNHAATIGGIDKNYLFYLNSKGISTESAIFLIKKGYLLSNLEITANEVATIEEIIGGKENE